MSETPVTVHYVRESFLLFSAMRPTVMAIVSYQKSYQTSRSKDERDRAVLPQWY